MGMYAFPVTVTREYPPPLPPVLFNGASLGPMGNKLARLIGLYGASWGTNWSTKLQKRLGLPATSLARIDREMTETRWPIRYGYSEAVSPRPADWPDHVEIVGYWWPQPRRSWQPSQDLVDFLADGPPPVFVTSGSFGKDDDGRMSEIFVESLRQAGVRGVIQTGWVGLRGIADQDLITIGEVDYGWLLPQTAAVVHRAGAGTTAAALRARVPAIPVPVSLDNFHWARRLVTIGASPGMAPAKGVTVDKLTHLIRRAVNTTSFRDRAASISALIEREDGAGRVAGEIGRLADATKV
jgi:UDP:flavonoid glycosyltransferase YjiC (YdhE family)